MKKRSFFCFTFVTWCLCVCAQQLSFSGPNDPPVFLNPSFAGSNGLLRSNISTRVHPRSINPYIDVATSIDAYLKPLYGGVAVSFYQVGINSIFSRSSLELTYAHYLHFPDKHLTIVPSIQAGQGTTIINNSNTRFNELPEGKTSFNYFNVNTGLLINYRKFFLGANIKHINGPVMNFFNPAPEPIQMNFHSSYTFKLGQNSLLQLMLRCDQLQKYFNLQLIGNAILYKYIIVGAGYTEWEEINIRVGARTNIFTYQIGYNSTYSSIGGNSFESFEVHLSYNLRKKDIRNEVPLFEKM